MGRRLILDSNILIAYERGTMDRSSLDDDELAIASLSVAEYRVGIELADTAGRAAERARALVAITSAVDVLEYTQATAAHHGRLLAHVLPFPAFGPFSASSRRAWSSGLGSIQRVPPGPVSFFHKGASVLR